MFVLPAESITIGLGLGTLVIIAYCIHNAYRRYLKPSNYILIAEKLGYTGGQGGRISAEQQQEALLQIFQLAGYFTLPNIWHDLNCIGNINNLEKIFQEIATVIKLSGADQADPSKFDVKYLRRNLFKSDTMNLQDALDLILFIGQHAFSREIGQERYELTTPEWITKYAKEFYEAARLLRLTDREDPSLSEYDGGWIAGASRMGLMGRIMDFNHQILSRKIKIHGETLVLAGERELWADIDGIPPTIKKKLMEASQDNIDIDTVSLLPFTDDSSLRIEEGKSYMKNLAEFYNIKLNSSEPFIQYKTKDQCPSNRYPNRVYANYDKSERLKLTETLMSHDLLRIFLHDNTSQIQIIDTLAEEENRPNTASTARDAAARFVQRILAGDYGEKRTFVILFGTNNPFIERQTLATQRQVDQVLEKYGLVEKGYQIRIEGVGFSCKQQLTIVHSEIGALLTEKWRIAVVDMEKSLGLKPKRSMKELLSQSRTKNIVVPEQPKIENNHFSNFVKSWLDLNSI